jgi:hypothetical protein
VRARDAAPDDADARAVNLALGLVDVGDALGVGQLLFGGTCYWASGHADPILFSHPNKLAIL